jgi:hypothetical protein
MKAIAASEGRCLGSFLRHDAGVASSRIAQSVAAILLFATFGCNSGGHWTTTGLVPFNFDDGANWNGVISDERREQTILFTTDRSMDSENSVHHF